ncbi:hypothetical protein BSCG_00260 [Bacteroides sp. 2_2_4]|nr:hypothetical protein BSCG_00260 [Bacteroides sp. 2_2_4]
MAAEYCKDHFLKCSLFHLFLISVCCYLKVSGRNPFDRTRINKLGRVYSF